MSDNDISNRFKMTYEQIVHAIKVLQRNVASLFSRVSSLTTRVYNLENPIGGIGGGSGGGTGTDPYDILIDEDDFFSNSDQHAPTQQSAKEYIDSKDQALDTRIVSAENNISSIDQEISSIDSRVTTIESGAVMETANTGSEYTFNLSGSVHFDLTLTDNCTFTFPETGSSGEVEQFWLYLKRDSTPDRTVTWDSDVKWPLDIIPALDGTALTMSMFKFTQLGATSRWYGECLGMGYTI